MNQVGKLSSISTSRNKIFLLKSKFNESTDSDRSDEIVISFESIILSIMKQTTSELGRYIPRIEDIDLQETSFCSDSLSVKNVAFKNIWKIENFLNITNLQLIANENNSIHHFMIIHIN